MDKELKGNMTLTEKQCLEILKEYKTPEHVVKHCKMVAKVAVCIAEELNNKGYCLDIDLIKCAALLHDVARVHEKHWEIGSDLLKNLGEDKAAEIVYTHMFYQFTDDISKISEVDIVCLGDRVVKEDEFVGVNVRMQYIIDKIEDIELKKIVKKKMMYSINFVSMLEEKLGKTIESIVKEHYK